MMDETLKLIEQKRLTIISKSLLGLDCSPTILRPILLSSIVVPNKSFKAELLAVPKQT